MSAGLPKLLLVDDNEMNLVALNEALRRDNVDVLCAKSGSEALELLLAHDVALAIIDVQMPEMDGFELAKLMRGAERAKHVPIIFVTAGTRDAERRFRGYGAGAVDFLYKPIEQEILKSKVAVFLSLDRQRRDLARLLEERTEAERRARESEARLQYALKATNDVVWDWDVLRDAQIWNQAGADLFGWTDVVKSPQNAAWWVERVHPDDRQRVAEGFHAVVEHPTLFHWQDEYRFLRKDGGYAQVFDRGYVLRDAQGKAARMIGAMQDITARKEAEAEVKKSEQRLRYHVSNAGLAVIEWDARWVVTRWEGEAEQMFGWAAQETLGKLLPDLKMVYDEDVAHVQGVMAQLSDGVTRTLVSRNRNYTKDGRVIHCIWHNSVLLDGNSRLSSVLSLVQDNTAQIEAEAGLRSLAGRLEQLVDERTRELVLSQDRLRALASELNLAEQRERKRLATELHDHLQQILVLGRLTIGQGKRAAAGVPAYEQVLKKVDDIFSDALTYTRTLASDLSPTVLRDHGLAAALQWLGGYMKKHDQTVVVTAPEDGELTLPEDQVILLFQSARELLINSAKHAGTGQATVIMEQREGNLSITVSDEGKGFDLAAAVRTQTGGISSKFGLFSIRERMRALGGSFELESALGKGTTATLTLPLTDDVRGKELGARGGKAGEGHESMTLLSTRVASPLTPQVSRVIRVLLVDDHVMIRQGLRTVLDNYPDIEVMGEAANGEEAIQLADQLRPAVVVMDINMPKMNGIEATAQIKTRHPKTIVIGLSVNASGENQEAMQRAGAVTLLTKEAALDELYGAIQGAVKN